MTATDDRWAGSTGPTTDDLEPRVARRVVGRPSADQAQWDIGSSLIVDPLTKVVLEQMLAGVSTRRFARTREPVGQYVAGTERSTSKSAVSREVVGRTGEHLRALMARRLYDVRLAALMLDGIDLKGPCCVVVLEITTDGVQVPLGLWDGSTKNKTVARHLLADLVERGLDVEQGVLVVLDGGKALRAAVREVLARSRPAVHPPQERNFLDHLPDRDRPMVEQRLRAAWKLTDHPDALDRLDRLEGLAGDLARSHPGAPRHCARVLRRRSRYSGSASTGGSQRRFRARTRSSR